MSELAAGTEAPTAAPAPAPEAEVAHGSDDVVRFVHEDGMMTACDGDSDGEAAVTPRESSSGTRRVRIDPEFGAADPESGGAEVSITSRYSSGELPVWVKPTGVGKQDRQWKSCRADRDESGGEHVEHEQKPLLRLFPPNERPKTVIGSIRCDESGRHPAKFIRVHPSADAGTLMEAIMDVWKLPPPSTVISLPPTTSRSRAKLLPHVEAIICRGRTRPPRRPTATPHTLARPRAHAGARARVAVTL